MRFSQILVSLNKSSGIPQQSIYELEETEMMDVIRHFFKKPYQKSKEDGNRCENLTERWENVRENFVLDGKSDAFDLKSLTTLLKETWQ